MRKLQIISLPLIVGIGFIYYYYSSIIYSPKSSTEAVGAALPPLTSKPPQYKIVEMNDRLPSFKLATIHGGKPYADGDRAQATVIHSLQLVDKCKQDPSLIVVDVGALLGTHSSYLNKYMI
jgi:hypothetical protein